MIQEPKISDLTQLLKKIQEEKLESDKCMQRTIRELEQKITECNKQIRLLKTEVQQLNDLSKKPRI